MKILTFSSYYTPEKASSLYLTEDIYVSMIVAGNTVQLFVPTPTRGVTDDERQKYKKEKKREQKYDGKLSVYRIALFREPTRAILRAIRYFILNIEFFFKGLFCKADLIFVQSTPPTQGLMAAALKKVKKIPFIYNLQDVFPDSLVNTGLTQKGSLLWKIGRWVENTTYRSADKIVVISNDFKRNIMAKGVPESKIDVIYNWVDISKIQYVEKKSNSLFDEFGIDKDKFTAVYAGSLGVAQNAKILVDVAEELKDNQDIQIVIFGQGEQEPEIRKLIEDRKLTNIRLLPLQPAERVSEVYSVGDVGIVTCMPGTGAAGMPSKSWSIMACSRPVVLSFDDGSELSQIITENECGLCSTSGDTYELRKSIVSLFSNKEETITMGRNSRVFAATNIDRTSGINKMKELFSDNLQR